MSNSILTRLPEVVNIMNDLDHRINQAQIIIRETAAKFHPEDRPEHANYYGASIVGFADENGHFTRNPEKATRVCVRYVNNTKTYQLPITFLTVNPIEIAQHTRTAIRRIQHARFTPTRHDIYAARRDFGAAESKVEAANAALKAAREHLARTTSYETSDRAAKFAERFNL